VTPRVEAGHVAAWVGVGGYGLGPGGSDEWIQAGVVTRPGGKSRLYVEVVRPGAGRTYLEVGAPVRRGEAHRVAVLEIAAAPGWWRAWVDGEPAAPAVYLPSSHGRFRPMATAESWDGGHDACNRFRFRFARVSLAAEPDGSWERLEDGHVLAGCGFRVIRRTAATFVAVAA
jgi:hypothetical protein